MTVHSNIIDRNQKFANEFTEGEMPILPKLNTVLLTCGDARVDPAHVLSLELGDAVVLRNNGGRVTTAIVEEIATLAFMVAAMTSDSSPEFNVILMQHTQCGAERFADVAFQKAIKAKTGIDVSEHAITDHTKDLFADINKLVAATEIPNFLTISALLYDVKTRTVREVAAPKGFGNLRAETANLKNDDQSSAS